MTITAVGLLALALGMDAFSMAVGLGITGVRRLNAVIVSVVVSLFHILMPLGGWSLGVIAGNAVGRLAGIFGAMVLIFIGSASLLEVFQENRVTAGQGFVTDQGRPGWQAGTGFLGLLVLAGSVSLDALSVGFGLGTLGVNLLLTLVLFGATAGIMTAGGFFLGRHLGFWLGNKADVAGALILIIIGIKMLL